MIALIKDKTFDRESEFVHNCVLRREGYGSLYRQLGVLKCVDHAPHTRGSRIIIGGGLQQNKTHEWLVRQPAAAASTSEKGLFVHPATRRWSTNGSEGVEVC